MGRWKSTAMGLAMLLTGYICGASGWLNPHQARAQDVGVGVTEDTAEKILAANRALQAAAEALRGEGRYEAATDNVNAFLVLSGGGDALADLSSGNGVDPETFVALHAGQAIDDVQDLVDFDDAGNVTYNGTPVRLYSRSRLERLYAERLKLTQEGLRP